MKKIIFVFKPELTLVSSDSYDDQQDYFTNFVSQRDISKAVKAIGDNGVISKICRKLGNLVTDFADEFEEESDLVSSIKLVWDPNKLIMNIVCMVSEELTDYTNLIDYLENIMSNTLNWRYFCAWEESYFSNTVENAIAEVIGTCIPNREEDKIQKVVLGREDTNAGEVVRFGIVLNFDIESTRYCGNIDWYNPVEIIEA